MILSIWFALFLLSLLFYKNKLIGEIFFIILQIFSFVLIYIITYELLIILISFLEV